MKTFFSVLNVITLMVLSCLVLLTLFSLLMIARQQENAVLVLVLCLIMDALFIGLFLYVRSKLQHLKKEALENLIFKIANDRGGLLTAMELAKDSRLTYQESSDILERMYAQQICDKSITEKGVHVYSFSGLLSDEDKKSAEAIPLLNA